MAKKYVILYADNFSYDIGISKLFDTKEEAQAVLKREYNNAITSDEEGLYASAFCCCYESHYRLTTINDDIHYAQIKEVEV